MEAKAELFQTQERMKDLEDKVMEAEESAKEKAEELSEVIVRLRKYENGEYGLHEAVAEVQSLRKQSKFKDKRIEELTQQANSFQYEACEIKEENNDLRQKLGIELRDTGSVSLDLNRVQTKSPNGNHTERALMQVLHREIERLEEERIQLKTENRKLAQQLGQRAAKLGLDAGDLQAIQEYTEALKNRRIGMTGLDGSDPMHVIKMHEGGLIMQRDLEDKKTEVEELKTKLSEQKMRFKEIYDENDKLRLGMHEILESIKNQDGTSDVMVSSPVLENLLNILDSRHLFGEYKPAMGLKSKMEKLEGMNAQLREELRKTRLNEDKANVQVQRFKSKIQQQDMELNAIKHGNMIGNPLPNQTIIAPQTQAVPQVTTQISIGAAENLAKLNSQLVHVLDELDCKTKAFNALTTDLEKSHQEYEMCKHQLGLLYDEHFDAQSRWTEEKQENDMKIRGLEEVRDAYAAKITEYENHLNLFDADEDTIKNKISETARKIGSLRSNEAIMTRRYKAVENQEKVLRSENIRLKTELIELENHATKTIGELKRSKEFNTFKIKSFQKCLEDTVPLSSIQSANRQYNEITAKYRDILQKQQSHSMQSRTIEELELQVQANKQEKEMFKKELLSAKEKILSMETLINCVGASKTENGSENSVEMERLTKQVYQLLLLLLFQTRRPPPLFDLPLEFR